MTRTGNALAYLAIGWIMCFLVCFALTKAWAETPAAPAETTTAQAQPAAAPQPVDGAPAELAELSVQLDALHSQGKCAAARAICQERLASATDPEQRAYFLWFVARTYAKEEAYDTAIGIYQQVLEELPNSKHLPYTRYYLAKAYHSKSTVARPIPECLTGALGQLQTVIRDSPAHSTAGARHARKLLGKCYGEIGDDLLSQQAGALDPNSLAGVMVAQRADDEKPAFKELVIGYSKLVAGNEAEAIQRFQAAVAWHADGDAAAAAKAAIAGIYDARADASIAAKDEAGTIAAWEAGCAIDSDPYRKALTAYQLAQRLIAQARFAEAHTYLGLVLADSSPSTADLRTDARYLDALAYYQAGNYSAALPALREVVASSIGQEQKDIAQSLINQIGAASGG